MIGHNRLNSLIVGDIVKVRTYEVIDFVWKMHWRLCIIDMLAEEGIIVRWVHRPYRGEDDQRRFMLLKEDYTKLWIDIPELSDGRYAIHEKDKE